MKDVFNKEVTDLKDKRLFLFDMDGTIYNENTLFDGTLDLLDEIVNRKGKYVFITNNSSKSVEDYIKKVTSFGIKADEDNFFTSSQATVLYLKQNYPGKKVYCQGTKSLIKELVKGGIVVTEEVEEDVGVILVGFDTELTSQKLRNTCELLIKDIPFIATNPDTTCPVSFGYIPDCGSICQMLENATKRKPLYIGKPGRMMIDIAREKYKASKEETILIGDRVYTDIKAGINAEISTIAVLTGESTKEEIETGKDKPTYTFNSVRDIEQILKKLK